MVDDTPPGQAAGLTEAQQQDLAIEKLLAVFTEAPELGIAPEKMAIVALSAAINNLVAVFGESKAAMILSTVPNKVLEGNFTTKSRGCVQ